MNSLSFTKFCGCHADTLAAVGAADLLWKLKPALTDKDICVEVSLMNTPQASDIANCGPGFKYLDAPLETRDDEEAAGTGKRKQRRRAKATLPSVPPAFIFDYRTEEQKYKRQTAAQNSEDSDVLESAQQDKPDPDFRTYRIVKVLQAESGLNAFIERFFSLQPKEREAVVLAGLHGSSEFFFSAPTVQLFNPQSAKGYALLKPTGTDRNDKTKEKWAVPFIEWLRYRGFFAGSSGWFLGKKGENIRVYTPIPKSISFDLYKQVAASLRAEPLAGTAPKIDCLAALRLTRILIERSDRFARPSRSISGLWVTHYQSLGQVKAVTSIDQLSLPDWAGLDATAWLSSLAEHDTVLRRLNDKISEELSLLRQYRQFLQTGAQDAINELIEFFVVYGQHILRLRSQGKWLLPQFSYEGVDQIVRPSYAEILDNSGFRALTNALRSATVSAQVAKSNGGDYREIRYGAIPEIRRKIASSREEFLQAISEFVTDFNTESAKRNAEQKSGFRISEDEFAAFVRLVDSRNDWETVGRVLCAMSTCKLGKEKDEA